MTTLVPDVATVATLADAVHGDVLLPGDLGFAESISGFNIATVHSPAVVVVATCAEDVAAAVGFARTHRLPVAVQATGHGAVTPYDGAVLICTRRMIDLRLDPDAATATLGAGIQWQQVIDAAAPYGLAPLCGSSPDVGAVGYTLGGGLPVLGRTFGFSADHVRRLEVVTADGLIREVTPESEPELFWAMRGGKGNFGIVTAMTVDLVRVATIYGGGLFFDGADAPAVLHRYRAWLSTLDERTTASFALLRLPPLPAVPEPLRGRFVVHVRMAHVGAAEEGQRLAAPVRAVAPALLDVLGELPMAQIAAVHADPVDPMPVWERGMLLRELTAETVDALLAVAGPGVDTPLSIVRVRQLGGALARHPQHPNAVAGRHAAFSLFLAGAKVPELAEVLPVVGRATVDALAPWRAEGCLVNWLGDATTAQVRAAYPAETYARLAQAKQAHDPANLFRCGHAIGVDAIPGQR
jgi:FAD/FMN-containing dehydrogenase